MRIDVSSDSFDLGRGYTRVLLQQGRPMLDRDWNEQTAIVLHQLREVTRAIYGKHGGPAGGNCGFIPHIKSGKLCLQPGWYTVDGLILNYHSGTRYDQASETAEQENGKTYLVYLEAFEREITAAEQKSLLDSAMPGVDMAARGQVAWRLKHFCWSADDAIGPCSDHTRKVNKWIADEYKKQQPPDVVLEDKDKDRLRGVAKKNPNQLLRVEHHKGSVWKFSIDNGFALFEIAMPKRAAEAQQATPAPGGSSDLSAHATARSQADTTEITIELGVLGGWVPAKLDAVELLTRDNVQFNEPGELRTVKEIKPPDGKPFEAIDRRTIVLDEPVAGDFGFLRAWTSKIELNVSGAEPGDYLQFAARDAGPDIADVKLQRPARVFAPLALLQIDSNGTPEIISRFQRIVGVPWREIGESIDLADST